MKNKVMPFLFIVKLLHLNLKTAAQRFRYTNLFALITLLQGCSALNIGSFEHGIHLFNYGPAPIYDVQIIYGQKTIRFAGITPPPKKPYAYTDRGPWNAGMPIPSEIIIAWRTDGSNSNHQVAISLKDKVPVIKKLQNWEIRFFGNQMELWREVATGPNNPYTHLTPTESQKVFP